jgi:hypothetical protein
MGSSDARLQVCRQGSAVNAPTRPVSQPLNDYSIPASYSAIAMRW